MRTRIFMVRVGSRTGITREWKRLMEAHLGYGLAHETLAVLDLMDSMKAQAEG